jgi:MarR family transcriptional regulator, transcriptional regulator for hemolysin
MQPHESLAHAFGTMSRLLERELRAACSEHHVLPGQLPVLLALYEHDGLTQSELAELTGVEQPTMAATLQRMESDGLVYRAPDQHDGRRVAVSLTAPARRLERPLNDAVRRVNRRAVRGLSAGERSLLYDLPERLRENLDRA